MKKIKEFLKKIKDIITIIHFFGFSLWFGYVCKLIIETNIHLIFKIVLVGVGIFLEFLLYIFQYHEHGEE